MRSLTLLFLLNVPAWAGGADDHPSRGRPDQGTAIPVPPRLAPNEVGGRSDDPGPGVTVDYRKERMTRRDPAGRLLWVAQVGPGVGMHREPHVLHDAARIYLPHGDGITARAPQTGKVA